MKTNMATKNEDLGLDYEKSEDPAKITHSIFFGPRPKNSSKY